MDVTLKIAIIGAIAIIIGALINLLGVLIGKGSSGSRVFTIIVVILALLGGGAFVLFWQTPTSSTTTDFLAGDWSGTVNSLDGSYSVDVNLSFQPSCNTNEICGTFDAYQNSCSGTLTLIGVDGDTFIFLENKTSGDDSCGNCYEHIQKKSEKSISLSCSQTRLSKDFQSTGILARP